jgi:cytosine/adenosine deaminase-related metal-dependent hydrolase
MRWVVDSAWIGGTTARGVAFTFEDGRIAAIERVPVPGNGWHALPGFVDAHAHLELTSLRGEDLPHATFAEWVDALIDARSRLDAAGFAAAVRAGARELLASGVVAVGDVDSHGGTLGVLRETPLEGIVYRELVGSPPASAIDRVEHEVVADARGAEKGAGLRAGLSPHAPFSTGEAVYRRAFACAARLGVPVASHVAETLEEEELLLRREGPLADLFDRRSFRVPEWPHALVRPFDRLLELAPPRGFVLIHGNHLADADLARCAAHGWPVVFCPESHRYFGHPRHPAVRLLARGGTLALGTDSRASNRALDLWREMACFRASGPDVKDGAILAAATSGGRAALGLEPAELRLGEPATLQLVRTRDGAALDPSRLEEAAVRGELETCHVLVRGRAAFGGTPAPSSR